MPINFNELVNVSLTNECLKYFEEKSKNCSKTYSLTAVRTGGSICSSLTAVIDTILQLALGILKVISGIIVSPVNAGLSLFTDKRLSENWDWSMAIRHLGMSLKHFTAIIVIPIINFRSNPTEARQMYFNELILLEKLKANEVAYKLKLKDKDNQIKILNDKISELTKMLNEKNLVPQNSLPPPPKINEQNTPKKNQISASVDDSKQPKQIKKPSPSIPPSNVPLPIFKGPPPPSAPPPKFNIGKPQKKETEPKKLGASQKKLLSANALQGISLPAILQGRKRVESSQVIMRERHAFITSIKVFLSFLNSNCY